MLVKWTKGNISVPLDLAMGDESSLGRQVESVERSMVFLRQEHLTLLHGLHLEILSLQKRCSGKAPHSCCVCPCVPEKCKKLLCDLYIFILCENTSVSTFEIRGMYFLYLNNV